MNKFIEIKINAINKKYGNLIDRRIYTLDKFKSELNIINNLKLSPSNSVDYSIRSRSLNSSIKQLENEVSELNKLKELEINSYLKMVALKSLDNEYYVEVSKGLKVLNFKGRRIDKSLIEKMIDLIISNDDTLKYSIVAELNTYETPAVVNKTNGNKMQSNNFIEIKNNEYSSLKDDKTKGNILYVLNRMLDEDYRNHILDIINEDFSIIDN